MKFGEVVKELEKIDLMVESHKYYYDFQYYYQLKYCDIVIRLFRDWLKIENCNNENQWEFSIDLDKMNNFSIEEKNNSYLIICIILILTVNSFIIFSSADIYTPNDSDPSLSWKQQL